MTIKSKLLNAVKGALWLIRTTGLQRELQILRYQMSRFAPPDHEKFPTVYDTITKEVPFVTELVVSTDNGVFAISPRDLALSRAIAHRGEWEAYELERIRAALKAGDLAIDIGANIGWHSVCMGRIVGPSGCVVAFEPEPYNYRLLQLNLHLNGLTDTVRALNRAVANASGSLELELSADNLGDHRIRLGAARQEKNVYGEKNRKVVTVPVVSLDAALDEGLLGEPGSRLLRERGVQMLKMDTQGAEARILAGAAKVLSRTQNLISEFWPYGLARQGSGVEEFLDPLFEHFDRAQVISSPERIPVNADPVSRQDLLTLAGRLGDTENLDLLFSKTRRV